MFAPHPPRDIQPPQDSDSDSDWDDDDEYGIKKISIKIKPVAQITPSKISASVDELRASVGTWKSLANVSLVKPNSRRHHQSTIHLNNNIPLQDDQCVEQKSNGTLQPQQLTDPYLTAAHDLLSPNLHTAFQNVSINNNVNPPNSKVPVAFAIQECLCARFIDGSDDGDNLASIVGHVKLAVPPEIIDLRSPLLESKLVISLIRNIDCDKIELNDQFIRRLDEKRLTIDMLAVQDHAEKTLKVRGGGQANNFINHILLPDLIKYTIRSRSLAAKTLCPLSIAAHWLCDLRVTKIRVNLLIYQNLLSEMNIIEADIKNLKISMHVDGDVTSYQSKPEASWNPLDSKLTWSFSSLADMIEKSAAVGTTSCLARFDVSDGPSSPSSVELQFSILGKTLSGSQVTLESENFKLTKQKFEVRTGTFRHDSPCIQHD